MYDVHHRKYSLYSMKITNYKPVNCIKIIDRYDLVSCIQRGNYRHSAIAFSSDLSLPSNNAGSHQFEILLSNLFSPLVLTPYDILLLKIDVVCFCTFQPFNRDISNPEINSALGYATTIE